MIRRSPLQQLSNCNVPAARPVSLSDSRIARALFASTVLCVLCLAHISLRFLTLDYKVQHRQLQERKKTLSRQEQELQRRMRLLSDDAAVRSAARGPLKLREMPPSSQLVASIPPKLVKRYARSADPLRNEPAITGLPTARPERSLTTALVSFVDVGRASAATQLPNTF